MPKNKTYLSENVEYIKRYNKTIESSLDIDINLEDFSFKTAKSGETVLCYKNLLLNSQEDPIEESYNLLNQILEEDNENAIHILIGIGTGYDFKIFSQAIKGKLILLELRLEILKMVLELIDFSDELCKKNVLVTTRSAETIEAVSAFYKENCNMTFSSIGVYKK